MFQIFYHAIIIQLCNEGERVKLFRTSKIMLCTLNCTRNSNMDKHLVGTYNKKVENQIYKKIVNNKLLYDMLFMFLNTSYL